MNKKLNCTSTDQLLRNIWVEVKSINQKIEQMQVDSSESLDFLDTIDHNLGLIEKRCEDKDAVSPKVRKAVKEIKSVLKVGRPKKK